MGRHYKRNGVKIPFTAQEEADQDAKELAYENARPLREWGTKMLNNDYVLPRYAEDILDAMNPSDFAGISRETKDKLIAKKALRATKPNEDI